MKDPAVISPPDLSFVDQAVARFGGSPQSLVPILQAMQEHYRYLPAPALRRLCSVSQITPAAVTGVSTFYRQFRHRPMGRHIVRVCRGTACHVKNSDLIEEALRRDLHIAACDDTDPSGQYTLQPVVCLGCCTLAPVVQVDEVTCGHTAPDTVAGVVADAAAASTIAGNGAEGLDVAVDASRPHLRIGVGSCCVAGGSMAVRHRLELAARKLGIDVAVKPVGCTGMCHQTPLVEVVYPGRQPLLYTKVTVEQAEQIVLDHFKPRSILRRAAVATAKVLDRILGDGRSNGESHQYPRDARDEHFEPFLGPQLHLATEVCGRINPLDIDEYIANEGFAALKKCLAPGQAESIIEQVSQSGLRGRGGAGFPTGNKWRLTHDAAGDTKYVICNGDEGDPGAFMDRMLLESYPYRVLEGLIIASLAVGAHEGILYIRHEYPLAVQRINQAIETCRQRGIVGRGILGSGHDLDLRVMEGGGAFVCGEETALMASIEGRRGMPRLRPPFPCDSGLWGKPTCVNNVETLALVPWIIRHGAAAFASIGTAASKGTKVFALTGKVQRGGLVEVPMGITIRQIVETIGGGAVAGRKFKAVQIGGPSGGCIPEKLADTPIDYESLAAVGAIMGSGGLVVMDDTDCMVDIARYFLQFTQAESCGKCTFCRVGTQRMLEILDRLCSGQAHKDDLASLEELCLTTRQGSLCGLGQTAPNPVLTTLKYFRDEYEAHLNGHCPAGRCKALIRYSITDACIGCTRCAQVCPVQAIDFRPYQRHEIDSDKCTRCDVCRRTCPNESIVITSRN